MAVPFVPTGGVGAVAAAVAQITPALPVVTGGFLDGDVIIGIGECESVTAPGAFPTAASNGFAHVDLTPIAQSTNTKLTVIWQRWTAGLTAHSWGDSGDHNIGRYIVIRGCKTSGNPWNVSPVTNTDATSDTSAAWAAVTTDVADCLVLFIGAWSDDVTTGVLTGGTGLTNIVEHIDSGTALGNDGEITLTSATKAAAGSTGAPTATLSLAAFKAMLTLAMEPEGVVTLSIANVTSAQTVQNAPLAVTLAVQNVTSAQTVQNVVLVPVSADAPLFRAMSANTAVTGASSATELTVSPTGQVIDDGLVAVLVTAGGNTTHSAPDGTWFPFGTQLSVGNNRVMSVWTKRCTATGETYTFTWDASLRGNLGIYAVYQVNPNDMFDGALNMEGFTGQTNFTYDAMTSNGENRRWVLFTTKNTPAGTTTTLDTPAGFTEPTDICSTHGTLVNVNTSLNHKVVGTGSTGTQLVTSPDVTSLIWAGAEFLLKFGVPTILDQRPKILGQSFVPNDMATW
jgi:hypothetical protein